MQKVEIYCDESRPDLFTSKNIYDKYLLIGGLKCLSCDREYIKERINKIKSDFNVKTEFKWNKVSKRKLEFYKHLIDLFFDLEDKIRFRCIAVEADKMDLEHFHDSDAELGFYKFYYQLLNNWILDYNEYNIFTDLKTNREKNRLNILCNYLDNSKLFAYVNSVQALPSRQVVLLQMTDLILGIAGARLNKSTKEFSAKSELLNYFESKLGHQINSTPKEEIKFNVFIIILQQRW